MPEFSVQQLEQWTDCQVLWPQGAVGLRHDLRLSGVSTDSRTISAGEAFVALSGEKFDGHRFIEQVISRGAALLVLAAQAPETSVLVRRLAGGEMLPGLLSVADPLRAYQQMAAGYRRTLAACVVAITGSVGKTSTRQMIRDCLAGSLRVHQTQANLNNEIGVPQTLLKAETHHQAMVIELGMRGPGEIRLLSEIVRPDVAVITNIGWSHIGRLGSREAILQAKAEILAGLREKGTLILNGDDEQLMHWSAGLPADLAVIRVSCDPHGLTADRKDADFWAADIQSLESGSQFNLRSRKRPEWNRPVRLSVPGLYHVRNALIGLAVSATLGLDPASSTDGAATYRNIGNRQHILQIGSVTVMDDSYNASPESMAAALQTLAAVAGTRRRLAALGSMLELGDFAAQAHAQVGEEAARTGLARLYCLGPHAAEMAAGALKIKPELPVFLFANIQKMIQALQQDLFDGDFLLVKGSRAFAMEQIASTLLAQSVKGV